MRVTCGNWRVWVAVVVLMATTTPARAFYWGNWPGSQLRVEQTLINPATPHTPGNPPTPQVPGQPPPTPGHEPVPPVGPPLPVDKPPVGPPAPHSTPEPATGLLGLLGLGALAAVRRWRSKGK